MEKRIGNVIIQAPGGTASKNSSTYKVSLPSAWIKEMGITESDRQIELSFDGTSITISKRLSLDEFIRSGSSAGHRMYLFSYYDNQTLCSKIAADYTDQTLCFENYINNFLRTAFGNNPAPTWEDFQTFLEERCISRSRAGLQEYMETIGVERYEPLDIIQKTKGRMAEDDQWIHLEVMT